MNPAVAPAVRLAKRWVGAQLLSNHLPDEAVELLVMAACGQCSAASTLPPPSSRLSGACRDRGGAGLDTLECIPGPRTPFVWYPSAFSPHRALTQAQGFDPGAGL